MLCKRNKKGIMFFEVILVFIIVFVAAVLILVGQNAFSNFNSAIQDSGINSAAKNLTSTANTKFTALDNGLLFILIGLCFVMIFIAYMVKFHPMFIFINIVLIPVTLILTMLFSNAYESMVTNTALSATSAQMGLVPTVMTKLPYFAMVLSIIVMIVMYSKREW